VPLVGSIVSFSRSVTSRALTAEPCGADGCTVLAALVGPQPNQQWIVADGGDSTIVLRSLQFGSLINVTSTTIRQCWPDHGSADCSRLPVSVQFRAISNGAGQMGLYSVDKGKYLALLAEVVDFSQELGLEAAMPVFALLQPTVVARPTFASRTLFYGHCDYPILDETECKMASAQQGVIQYSQFSSWSGDTEYPPHCFYMTETLQDSLEVARLVLNVHAGAAATSYAQYAQCSRARPCLCKTA